jgi:hypothetical protein
MWEAKKDNAILLDRPFPVNFLRLEKFTGGCAVRTVQVQPLPPFLTSSPSPVAFLPSYRQFVVFFFLNNQRKG